MLSAVLKVVGLVVVITIIIQAPTALAVVRTLAELDGKDFFDKTIEGDYVDPTDPNTERRIKLTAKFISFWHFDNKKGIALKMKDKNGARTATAYVDVSKKNPGTFEVSCCESPMMTGGFAIDESALAKLVLKVASSKAATK